MNICLVFVGLFENKSTNEVKAVLKEKDGDRSFYLNVKYNNVDFLRSVLSNDEYCGIFAIYISTVERFGFTIKKMILDANNNVSSVIIDDSQGNEFIVKLDTLDAVILSTYNDSPIYIDEKALNEFQQKIKKMNVFINYDLGKYTLSDLYNMLKRVRYDDNFLEEAIRIRDEIRLREDSANVPYYNGVDLIY